jgi:hypothetical protein
MLVATVSFELPCFARASANARVYRLGFVIVRNGIMPLS